MLRSDFIFNVVKGCHYAGNKSLLVIFYTAAVENAVFFYTFPGICVPEFQIAGRNYVHVGHHPDPFCVSCSRNCNYKRRANASANPLVWSFKLFDCYAVFGSEALGLKPFFQKGTFFCFTVAVAFRGNCRAGSKFSFQLNNF